MKPSLAFAALLVLGAPAQAATGVRAPLARPAMPIAAPQPAAPATALSDTCTRDGMRKGRYSAYSWCEWFSYFHQFKN